jgi:hypothetical protein
MKRLSECKYLRIDEWYQLYYILKLGIVSTLQWMSIKVLLVDCYTESRREADVFGLGDV